MDPIALYYPHVHVRDDRWLKYAALYWPKMARLRPARYPSLDSETAQAFGKSGWLFDIQPQSLTESGIEQLFLELIDTHAATLRDRFGFDRIDEWEPLAPDNPRANRLTTIDYDLLHRRVDGYFSLSAEASVRRMLDDRVSYLHISRFSPSVVDSAVEAGVAAVLPGSSNPEDESLWVGMHPQLASVYMCALTEQIAVTNRLHPLTDQLMPHSALSGWTLDRLADVLLAGPLGGIAGPRPPRDLWNAFVLLAFETVVPAHLDRVPVEKILEIRSKFSTELDAFREYVTNQVEGLSELRDVQDLTILREYLHSEVQHAVTTQLTQLREQLRSVGLESARALVNVKSVALPPLAGMAAQTIGLSPTITGPAALAACLVTAPAQWRRKRQEAIRKSPVGYLFQIERALNPTTLIDKLQRTWPT